MEKVRVRFAPSPTGPLHIGGVRTALYNYLFARKYNGTFIIRIEDTDQSRFVPGAEEYIFESLRWLGLEEDESTLKGGPYAPYRQSERLDIYKKYVDILIQSGQAYYAFDTAESLEKARSEAPDGIWQYHSATRLQMENSLSLPEDETRKRLSTGHPYVVRLKVPKNEEIRFEDQIRGWVMVHSSTLDDKVLLKSDGMPTYHLANVVDDYLMEISHVIRGEEWLPSAPTHVLLYRAFGWEKKMPQFAHLPLLLKPSGDGKLSKRDGEALGFPVFPISWTDEDRQLLIPGFKEKGYLPEALINFLAFLGWNPGTEREFFSLSDLIDAFSIERIGKSGTRFDIQKANWFNHHYLQSKADAYFKPELEKILGKELNPDELSLWIKLVKERCSFEWEMLDMISALVQFDGGVDASLLQEKWNNEVAHALELFAGSCDNISFSAADQIKAGFSEVLEANAFKPGKLLLPLRIALTGRTAGPDLMLFMQLIGPLACKNRLETAIRSFRNLI
jgi:glutamyl-tRNA synthetase